MPNTIKFSLEKGKKIDGEWKIDNWKPIISDCINIEKNIEKINEINGKLIKCNSQNVDIRLNFAESQTSEILEKVKIFGELLNCESWIESIIISSSENKSKLKNTILSLNLFIISLMYKKI
jgi:hypothetical protein